VQMPQWGKKTALAAGSRATLEGAMMWMRTRVGHTW